MDITLELLENITNSFSEEHKIGSGGYGIVYQGVLHNGQEIAVKKLYPTLAIDDKQFKTEFGNLMRIQKHQNIISLVGYCYEVRHRHVVLDNGEYILARMEEKALCFEYMPNGSLQEHLSDESSGLGWRTRYKIMKGICNGLNYLHTGLIKPMYHLDLKPSNILLDKDMVPKVADFGLSRFLMTNNNSHITTENFKGTMAYVPPEYIKRRHISNKYDIFSLGIIFIEVVSGPRGYSTYVEMVPEEFSELVQKNWRNRIRMTSKFTEEYCQQVKRCIEIAVKCLEVEKNKRPEIGDIISMLTETETVEQREDEENFSDLAKFGPWGGKGGGAIDIEMAPNSLDSITIGCGTTIDSIKFSYTDHDGQYHTSGPWGWSVPQFEHMIQLGPSEFLTGVSGSIGPHNTVLEAITSLTFVTNARSYGPFGKGRGNPFHIPVQTHDCIVGFFGRCGKFLDAIGVYTKRNLRLFQQAEGEVARIGPWGGDGGRLHDITIKPHRLESVTIFSGTMIDSLAFTYSDRDEQQHTSGSWGGSGGGKHVIHLDDSESIVNVSGTFKQWGGLQNVVTSLAFVSSTGRRYGPYGLKDDGTAFHVPVQSNGRIVGFFAHGEKYIEGIGVYISTL